MSIKMVIPEIPDVTPRMYGINTGVYNCIYFGTKLLLNNQLGYTRNHPLVVQMGNDPMYRTPLALSMEKLIFDINRDYKFWLRRSMCEYELSRNVSGGRT
jgi:hypothetical protein